MPEPKTPLIKAITIIVTTAGTGRSFFFLGSHEPAMIAIKILIKE